ncbi:MAG: hypothetical protein AB7I41_01385 [Candidatus Sericytochromatia bacterium]
MTTTPNRTQLDTLRKQAKPLRAKLDLDLPLAEAWQRCFRLPELHHSMGLPEETYVFHGHPLGWTEVKSMLFSLPLTFWESPLVWKYGQNFQLERIGQTSTLAYICWDFEFEGNESQTQLKIALHLVLSPPAQSKLLPPLKAYLMALVAAIKSPQNPVNQPVAVSFSALYSAPSLQHVLEKFHQGLSSAALYRQGLHPRALEKVTALPREQILRALLELCLLGHLSPVWCLHEPDGTLLSQISPDQFPVRTRSRKYGFDYDLQPDYHLSLWFSPAKTAPFAYSPFPADQPYRISQFWLWQGQSQALTLDRPGAYRLASPSLPGHVHLRVGARGVAEVQVKAQDRLEDREWPLLAAGGQLKLTCQAEPGALFYCYTPYESQGPMTGAQAISCGELAEVIPECRPRHAWKIGQQVILLVGLLEGNPSQSQHFHALLAPCLAEFAGALLQTSPDTALLLFPWAESGLRAALKILKDLRNWNIIMPASWQLKLHLALHRGGALLTPQAEKWSLSGPGLRHVMQLLDQSQAHELLFSRTLMQDPGFQQILATEPALEMHEIHRFLRGPALEPERIYRLALAH